MFKHFTDAQMLNPGYALHGSASGATWCKLCDAPVQDETGEQHLARHARELAAYRRQQRARVAETARRNLAKSRTAA